MKIVLSIETSCDETAVAVVRSDKAILSSEVYSQVSTHAAYGGVIPEVAARKHLEVLPFLAQKALITGGVKIADISAIAATTGPGLYGSLLIGTSFAKTLALFNNKPYIPVNHLEAHLLTVRLCADVSFPFLALLASGGNTLFAIVKGAGEIEVIGETQDDAIGEAYDKTARLLGFPYPGGKYIEVIARGCDSTAFSFNPPMLHTKDCDMSFSGLKTSVSQTLNRFLKTKKKANHPPRLPNNNPFQDALVEETELPEDMKSSIAKAFESSVLQLVEKKTQRAIDRFKSEFGHLSYLVLCGGVAANQPIREQLQFLANKNNGAFCAPPVDLCGDNAAMVAWTAIEHLWAHKSENSVNNTLALKSEECSGNNTKLGYLAIPNLKL